ncbi:MAG: DUF1460 domain-containing protein, partial [Desulfuromonadales bacterium]|nr:DUF1460 domain-containing protein [Desulfuromonadales bacterium]NIS43796.1 DUF1460 domain-containing protein [Desulfuromonadales bacterium]
LIVLISPADLRADIEDLFRSRPLHAPPGEQIVAISNRFLGTPYRAGTLGGGPGQTEALTVSLDAVDCFTLLDYVEA